MVAIIIIPMVTIIIVPQVAPVAVYVSIFIPQLTALMFGSAIVACTLIMPQFLAIMSNLVLVSAYVTTIFSSIISIMSIMSPILSVCRKRRTAQHSHRQYSHQNLFHLVHSS
jgi:uncharacterized membrane protein